MILRVQRVSFLLLLFTAVLIGCGQPSSDSTDQPDSRNAKKNQPGPSPNAKSADKTPNSTKPPYALPREQFEAGWIKLFDGHSKYGWQANSDANWSVQDGTLTANKGNEGLLLTTVPFADYELKCECRLEKGGNSGIFLRTIAEPKDPGKDCYEFNLCDTHKTHPTGSLVARKVADVKTASEGDWQSYHITVSGMKISATLDGKQVLDFTDESANKRRIGFIGLQFREGKIEFRNVLLKPLSTKPIFNGKDLSGWKPTPGSEAKITVEDGAIHVKGGKGNLKSDAEWGDFLLQSGVRTNAKDVNSGIFFRAMKDAPNQSPNGYELQIHNGFADGDRTKPNDYQTGYGSGAIFRFAKVRRVIPDDKQWFTMTLVAYGDRFATWVNGYQVVDWQDKRKPNENPRRGRRLKPGYLFLQSHDPTTDVSFRVMNVAELPSMAKSK